MGLYVGSTVGSTELFMQVIMTIRQYVAMVELLVPRHQSGAPTHRVPDLAVRRSPPTQTSLCQRHERAAPCARCRARAAFPSPKPAKLPLKSRIAACAPQTSLRPTRCARPVRIRSFRTVPNVRSKCSFDSGVYKTPNEFERRDRTTACIEFQRPCPLETRR